jgi:hypothetical protein
MSVLRRIAVAGARPVVSRPCEIPTEWSSTSVDVDPLMVASDRPAVSHGLREGRQRYLGDAIHDPIVQETTPVGTFPDHELGRSSTIGESAR